MKLPRWLVPWKKHTDQNTKTPITATYGFPSRSGWVGEAFGGAWQRNLVLDGADELLGFAAIFACVSLIAGDISKLRIKLLRSDSNDIWLETEISSFAPVLRKPNRYQTRPQFIEQWVSSKLIWGNTYVLKERDRRGVVEAMYVLNPASVRAMIAPDSSIYYQLGNNRLAGVPDGSVTVPASEIIHDRGQCLFHPLVGVSPLYAAAAAGTQGRRIQSNSKSFFENMSRPGGHLTAPGTIPDATAARLKSDFETGFSGINLGKLFVSGDGLRFEQFSIPAEQAQLIEQLKWTGEDVARAFLVPAYKIGLGSAPSLGSAAALNQEYYQQVLQRNIEGIEALLDDGLDLPSDLSAEFDLDQLLRMDAKTRAETIELKIKSGVMSPNEARRLDNLPPVPGGDSPYLQQ
ncbi:MAG: phage portal protein, partial [Burkholderiales bacterium]